MSVEALAYVKTLDLGDCEKARLLMYVIGENTFNDTFVCRVGIEELAFQLRRDEKTVRRQLAALESRVTVAGVRRRAYVLRARRNGVDGGRRFDDIRLVGYKRWYLLNYAAAKRSHRAKNSDGNRGPQADILPGSQADKMSGSNRTPVSGSNRTLMSGTYKDSRTSPRTSEDARLSAREDSISDLKVKEVRARLMRELGTDKFRAWFGSVDLSCDGAVVTASTANKAVRNWIRDRYENLILRASQSQWPSATRVNFILTTGATA